MPATTAPRLSSAQRELLGHVEMATLQVASIRRQIATMATSGQPMAELERIAKRGATRQKSLDSYIAMATAAGIPADVIARSATPQF